MKRFILTILLLSTTISLFAQERSIMNGMILSKSTRIRKAIYMIDASLDTAKKIIIVQGNNIVIDFNNADLRGSNKMKNPDEFFGVALLIQNSKNVTIKNLKARGYKVALIARNVDHLTLDNCDFSYNYRQHLNSTQEKEDISDWMSYHHDEKDEWLRYGAAMYLRGCDHAIVRNCRVTGGQNALMMMECNEALITKNDFSFNSGIGLGMYRCNRNEVSYNKIMFNVRGYSDGVYNRGQDSAGILVYEQSNDNKFYYNNVTHGGDGFFLWAGQTTMDTGGGGCNNNILIGNDFSYAPTNGIEVTFSSNFIANNRLFECDHGIWGGYSYYTTIKENQFRNNRIAVAIEHGQRNLIGSNTFVGDREAIRIWSSKIERSDWGYPKYRDTRSAAYRIELNSFNNNPFALNASLSDSIWFHDNSYGGIGNFIKIDSLTTHFDSTFNSFQAGSLLDPVFPNMESNWQFENVGRYRGRNNIMITEWGPYDFRYPMIWNTNPTGKNDSVNFDLSGPKGKWSYISSKGMSVPENFSKNDIPKQFALHIDNWPLDDTAIVNRELTLEFIGEAFIDQFGNTVPANKPYRVTFKKFFQPIQWDVLFYSLDTLINNPIKTGMIFSPTEKKAPFKNEKVNSLDYAWWGGIKAGGNQHEQFITLVNGHATIPKGNYELSVTWDDAVRVYIDERLVIDEWDPSKYDFNETPHKKVRIQLGGEHSFRVEHLELGGFAALSLKLRPVD